MVDKLLRQLIFWRVVKCLSWDEIAKEINAPSADSCKNFFIDYLKAHGFIDDITEISSNNFTE